jgi:hypothetical protein
LPLSAAAYDAYQVHLESALTLLPLSGISNRTRGRKSADQAILVGEWRRELQTGTIRDLTGGFTGGETQKYSRKETKEGDGRLSQILNSRRWAWWRKACGSQEL